MEVEEDLRELLTHQECMTQHDKRRSYLRRTSRYYYIHLLTGLSYVLWAML